MKDSTAKRERFILARIVILVIALVIGWQFRMLDSAVPFTITSDSAIDEEMVQRTTLPLHITNVTSNSNTSNSYLSDTQDITVKVPSPNESQPTEQHSNLPSTATIPSSPLTLPLQLLEEYKQWHSNEALLRRKTSLHNQTFVVGFYACPDSAGNRMHEFFNAMIQAIANNFTIFVKFHDLETCLQTQIKDASSWCKSVNSLPLCDELVQRAPWLPLYDDWKETLNLTIGKRGQLDAFNANTTNQNMIWIPREVVFPVSSQRQKNPLKQDFVPKRYDQLYSLGSGYLYGMLFRHLFPFHPSILPENPPMTTGNVISIALHSRHYDPRHNGSNVDDETNCLTKVLKTLRPMNDSETDCQIFIMSDRSLTLEGVQQYAKINGCTARIADHQKDKGLLSEHGPFALKGFFQDLSLIQYAQSAFVGHCGGLTTSSDLVRELVEYNAISHGNRPGKLPTCCLAKKKVGNKG